jgi:predicted nuclease of predicted toxin-antitoxin system
VLLIADENVHADVIAALRAAGHDVQAVIETIAGSGDRDVLRLGAAGAVLITYDRDFGELIFKHGLAPPAAVLYVRMPLRDWRAIADRLLETLTEEITGRFIVVEREKARSRALPQESGVDDG